MRIAVFLHGTTLMHRSAAGCPREERVWQVQQREESVHDFASYVPIGNAVNKLHAWSKQGANMIYISSHRRPEDVALDQAILTASPFPDGPVLFRAPGESYQGVIERALPDLLIEDDCESIGGQAAMISPNLRPDLQAKVTSIIVREFEGIDHLPDDLALLQNTK